LAFEQQNVGDPTDLTPGIDLAYRVIEMALRTAAARDARTGLVTVHYTPRDIELEIRGDRAIPDLDRTVAPLVHRVALYDGELRTEQAPHGFVLRARIPLEAAVPA
jgi:hypothetical protein